MDSLHQLNEEQIRIIDKARERVIESVGNNMDLYGVTLSTGHLYGMLMFKNKPMTLDEMGQEMGMSKTSMSTGVRTLLDLKMVKKVWGKGSRKDLYEVERDWYQNFSDYFVIKWRMALEINLQALNRSLRELKALADKYPDDEYLQASILEDMEKMEESIRYYDWLDRLIDTLENGDIFQLVPKEAPAKKR